MRDVADCLLYAWLIGACMIIALGMDSALTITQLLGLLVVGYIILPVWLYAHRDD